MTMLSRLEIVVPEELGEELTNVLALRAKQGWEEIDQPDGSVLFRLHFKEPELAATVADAVSASLPEAEIRHSEIEDQNWAAAWREFFTPVREGGSGHRSDNRAERTAGGAPLSSEGPQGFEILPPWLVEQADPSKTTIVIDPGMAFGTGHHPTTAMCLDIMDRALRNGLVPPGTRFLDIGTGSGILGIGCARRGLPGLGVDNDPLAADACEDNALSNQVESLFQVAEGTMADVETLAPGETFGLILANILAEPLLDLAPDIAARLAPGAALILSGILNIQAEAVIKAYMDQGLPRPIRVSRGDWTALFWTRLPAPFETK